MIISEIYYPQVSYTPDFLSEVAHQVFPLLPDLHVLNSAPSGVWRNGKTQSTPAVVLQAMAPGGRR